MKKIIGIVLLLVAFAFTADYKPFTFENVPNNDSIQQMEWDILMKYKAFGANSFSIANNSVRLTDKSGWIGTSKGDLVLAQNGGDTLGGPIVVGGDLTFKNGPDVFTTGPLNVYGNVNVTEDGFKGRANIFNGFQCVKGTVDTKYEKFVPDEYKYFGENYENCPIKDTHPNDTNLVVPYITTADTTYEPSISIDNITHIIEVPNGSYKEPYDLYIDKISFANSGKLVISQQSGGRLTRIFLKNGISYSNQCSIVVAYRDSITGENVELENSDYSGTLLFYSLADITTASFNKDVARFQGSIISYGKIEVAHHMVLAGQLLANNMKFDTDFDGSGFLYVPFDPPVLNIDPTALASGKFIENNIDVKIPITLDTIAKTTVYFNYCFDLDNSKASIEDFNEPLPPICGVDSGSVVILDSTKTPVTDVFLNVKNDNLVEGDETLKLKIFNLTGAVLPGNVHTGYFTLTLTDGDVKNTSVVLDKTDTIKSYQEELHIPPGTGVVGEIKYTDDELEPLIWTIEDPSGLFTVVDGIIYTNHVFDYETEDTIYVIKVKVADGEFLDSANYIIKITNIQEHITITGKVDKVDENSEIGTPVGVIIGKDADSTAVSYTINTTDFKIDQLTGVITTNTLLDYENKSSYPVKVTITSSDGSIKDTSFVIVVNDVNEPVHTKDTTCSVHENYTGKVCKITGTDEDKTLVKFIVTDTTNYSIDSTGQLVIKNPIDYEKKTKDTVKVIVTDGEFFDTAIVVIDIKDIIEVVKITDVDHEPKKDTIKTNDPNHNIDWKLCEGNKCYYDTLDVVVEKDTTIKVCNENKTVCDSVVILFNDAPPVVTLTNAKSTDALIDYITIEEEKDDKIYVNKKNNEITITVKDTIHKTEKHFNIDVSLDTVSTKDIKLTEYNYIIDETKAKVVPIGNNLAELVEVIKVDGIEVELKQVIDIKTGRPIDTVQTVTYTKKVDGKNVVVSYKTDNLTGQKIGDYEVSYMIDSCTKVTYFVDDNKKIVKNKEGNIAYTITYEYTDDYGNKASAKVEIVYDDIPPKVEILNPTPLETFKTNAIIVEWTVNGVVQDTLTLQRLEKGGNIIKRRYVDKAGNIAEDSVLVIMKEAKDIDITIIHPVTEVNQDKVDEYYSEGHKYNDKKPYDVKFVDPKNDSLPETIGIGFKVDIVLPSVSPTGNVSTLSDIVKNDKVPVDEKGNVVGASNLSIPVEEYINENCTDDFIQDYHKNGTNIPLYNVKYNLHLWIYTSNANYVNDFEINYDIDSKTEANSAGIANIVIDWIPEKDGHVKAKNQHSLGTGAYIVKLYSKSTAIYRCGFKNQKAGDKITKKEYNLKSFGYKRPNK